MGKPVNKPEWTEGNPDFNTITVEPPAAKKLAGWLPDERPPREFMNWLFNNLGEWINYLEEQTDLFTGQSIVYDAFVGGGGTHVDINDLMADPDIASIKNVLIVASLSVDNTQVVNQPGMNFEFKPGASIIKNGGTGAILGLQIDADRVRILNGRFIGFNQAGNKAMQLNGNNCIIMGNLFSDNVVSIDDVSETNSLVANIEEV